MQLKINNQLQSTYDSATISKNKFMAKDVSNTT